VSIKNDGHYFCRAGGNRPDGLNEPVTFITITAPQIRVKKKKWCRRENNQQQSRRLSPETRTGLSMYQRYSCPPQTRPKKRKPEQKEMEKRRKRATSRKRLAIQDRKLQRTVDQVQLHSAKPHASGAY
ncbi:hypothetical protein, partial [Salmonella enterica]|uniref:hypothetical protein n=1 Tax=Salmonella enterica TaxID=28901 RepID=UPI001F1A2F7A